MFHSIYNLSDNLGKLLLKKYLLVITSNYRFDVIKMVIQNMLLLYLTIYFIFSVRVT